MEIKLNEPVMGQAILSLTYTGIETELAVETIKKQVVDPQFVIIIFAPKPSLLWKKFKGWLCSLPDLFRRAKP
jgi:hypothetical protein